METFQISNKSKIYIYGAAFLGERFYSILNENGISVCGFIDRRADEIKEFCDKPVFGISEEALAKNIPADSIIIVGVKNVFQHETIVSMLIEAGYHKLIYKPTNSIKETDNDWEKMISKAFDDLSELKVPAEPIATVTEHKSIELIDHATVEKTAEERVVYCPTEIVFTTEGITSKWAGYPIMLLYPHLNFWKWLENVPFSSPKPYMNYCIEAAEKKGLLTTKSWKRNVLENRIDVYRHMNYAYERDYSFFIRNAPYATWNEKGYFNIVSGKHRMSFLAAKGKSVLPIKISNDDFEKWLNFELYKDIIKDLSTQGKVYAGCRLEHPYFYEDLCKNNASFYNALRKICDELMALQYADMQFIKPGMVRGIYIDSNDDGYFRRCLERFGYNICDSEELCDIYIKSLVNDDGLIEEITVKRCK